MATVSARNPGYSENPMRLVPSPARYGSVSSPRFGSGEHNHNHETTSDSHEFSTKPPIEGESRTQNAGQRFSERLIHWYQKNEAIRKFKDKTGLFHCGYTQFGISELSCSHYTLEAIRQHGVIKGCVMGFCRILMCNPLTFHVKSLQKFFIKP